MGMGVYKGTVMEERHTSLNSNAQKPHLQTLATRKVPNGIGTIHIKMVIGYRTDAHPTTLVERAT